MYKKGITKTNKKGITKIDKNKQNYLEGRPSRAAHIGWSVDNEGKITLQIANRGVFNRIAQKLLKKPKTSYVHLDELGSFIWPMLDGEKTITELGKAVEEAFGKSAHPLYERLATYINILDSYGFVCWEKNIQK